MRVRDIGNICTQSNVVNVIHVRDIGETCIMYE